MRLNNLKWAYISSNDPKWVGVQEILKRLNDPEWA